MSEYKPAVGDRVRITTRTLEGEVVRATFNDDEGYLQQICLKGDDGFYGWVSCSSSYVTVEKLAPSEPVWVNGDVILVIGDNGKRTPMIYVANGEGDRFWACAECSRGAHPMQHVSADWSNGDVEVLYKADGQNAA